MALQRVTCRDDHGSVCFETHKAHPLLGESAMSDPVLVVMFGPRRGITRTLDRRLLVGRGPDTDLQLIDEKVSREHCVFERLGDEVVVRDLGSRNGTAQPRATSL